MQTILKGKIEHFLLGLENSLKEGYVIVPNTLNVICTDKVQDRPDPSGSIVTNLDYFAFVVLESTQRNPKRPE